MTEAIFRFDRQNVAFCQELFRGRQNRDYFEGEYVIGPSEFVEVQADKKVVGAASVILLKSRSHLKFRRTRAHIRRDNIDMTVLWFIRRGSLRFAAPSVEGRSASPFFMECLADGAGQHEVLHVTIPTHLIRPFIADDVGGGLVIAAGVRPIEIAGRIVDDLFADDEPISSGSDQRLLEAAISLIADGIADSACVPSKRLTIAQRRTEDVMRFINFHLCNPDLSASMVCKGCGISPRYLTTLLQMHGTSFTAEVWGQRMTKARDWLSSTRASDVPVSEVAHGLGFKSVAHFSRRFKQVFNHNPSEYRSA